MSINNRQFEIEVYLHYTKIRNNFILFFDRMVAFDTYMGMVLPHVDVNWIEFYQNVFVYNAIPTIKETIHHMKDELGYSYREIGKHVSMSHVNVRRVHLEHCTYKPATGDYTDAIVKWTVVKREANLL